MSLREARDLFFARSNLGPDGGYASRWVRVETKPLPFYFPNCSARVAAARLHDLHHIATNYKTDWPGEAEISAWEIGGGYGHYYAAWILDLGGWAPGSSSPREDCFAPSCAADRRKRICITLVLTKSISTKAQSAGCAINLDCTCRLRRQRCATLRCSAFG
jgi:hypothetical protein